MEILTTGGQIALGVFGLGIMIFIHELGHLLAAKALGLKVETFSLGYGKKLVGFEMGGTTYQIALVPIGGFCKMQGEHLFAKAVEENLDRIPDDEDHYYKAPPWKRIVVSFAGAGANLLFAFIFLTVLFTIGFNEYTLSNRIILASDYSENNSMNAPANRAGLQTGDRIVKIIGRETRHWNELAGIIAARPDEELSMEVFRNNEIIPLKITPEFDGNAPGGKIGVMAWVEPIIDKIDTLNGNANPWLVPGDRFISMNNIPVRHTVDISAILSDKPLSVPVVIERNGQQVSGTMTIAYNDNGNAVPGIVFQSLVIHTPEYSFFEAAGRGFTELTDTASHIYKFLTWIPRITNMDSLSGPVKTTVLIGMATGQSLEHGLDNGIVNFIRLISLISIVLAIMNLLPLPMLDGGFIVLFGIEWIRNKPWRPRFIMRFQLVGIAVFALLFIFILFNDITTLPRFF